MTEVRRVIVPFVNNSPIDWSEEKEREKMKRALTRARQEFGKTYPLIVNGIPIHTVDTISSFNPANFREVVGNVSKADRVSAEKAVRTARKSWQDRRKVSAGERADCLFRAAEIMRHRKFELMAWAIFEAGKSWSEADGDVSEAIDFLEYYAREMIRLSGWHPSPRQIAGEINQYRYVPKGVSLVLGIWNFILAINAGMTSAGLVTGNSVIFKPASLTPVMGYKLVEILQEAGFSGGALNYLPGLGAEVGEYLVKHPGVDIVVVTGSKEAGRRIIRLAGEFPPVSSLQKKIIAETGGKDAAIIDSDADLDEAVKGTLISAFSFQGQKCSAMSRCIVHEAIYDEFVRRLIEAAESLTIGPPEDSGNFLGPLIGQAALRKVQEYVEIGKKEAKLVFWGEVPRTLLEKGYYHSPVIFSEVHPSARIAQEEIFGPVLSIIKAKTLEEAIQIANNSQYALTGGVYSRNPSHIKKVKEELEAGVKYVNKKITGALVGQQPFGGYKCSGTGVQAGGPDYLKQFMNTEVVSENLMCRGYAPV